MSAPAALSADVRAWALECLCAGDDPREVASECGLSADQLLAAAGVRKPMSPRQAEVASLYAAGAGFRSIDRELWANACGNGRISFGVIQDIRRKGFDIPKRPRSFRESRT